MGDLARQELGRTGEWISRLGQGTTQTGPLASADADKDRRRAEVLRLGVELGMDFIDTAELYGGGHAEELLGRALGGLRQKVFLASKFNPAHARPKDLDRALDGSLRRLRTDWLDLYQMHWPSYDVPIADTLGALEEQRVRGRIRYYGVGNLTLAELRRIRSWPEAKGLVSVQAEYNPSQRGLEEDLLPYCRQEGLTVLAYSLLERGAYSSTGASGAVVQELANRHDVDAYQILLRWVLSRQGIVGLVKSADPDRTRANARALHCRLPAEEVAMLDRAFLSRVKLVSLHEIRLPGDCRGGVYRSLDEARRNPLDLVPAPTMVARGIREGHWLKPVPVRKRCGRDGEKFDLLDAEPLYWGWVLARGFDSSIPAVVKGEPCVAGA